MLFAPHGHCLSAFRQGDVHSAKRLLPLAPTKSSTAEVARLPGATAVGCMSNLQLIDDNKAQHRHSRRLYFMAVADANKPKA
jgi:hypothetical protein